MLPSSKQALKKGMTAKQKPNKTKAHRNRKPLMKWLTGIVTSLFSGLAFSGSLPSAAPETFINDKGKQQRIEYTPYYFLDYVDEPSGLNTQIFITLGEEMLPDDLKKTYKKVAKNMFKQSEHVYAVANLYFINSTQQLIDVHLDAFTWNGNSLVDDTHYDIPPRVRATSERSVSFVFYLQRDFDINMDFTINERKVHFSGKAKHLTN